VGDSTVKSSAAVEPNFTVVAAPPFVPLMTTGVLPSDGPVFGVTSVTLGVMSRPIAPANAGSETERCRCRGAAF
jgi:hypothetical protein